MAVLYSNNAFSTLASGINSSVTSMAVAAGQGTRFPVISGADYFYLTISSGVLSEIVKVTARTTDTMTIVRAQDSTTAQIFSAAASVQLMVNKVMLDDIKSDASSATYSATQTLTNKRINPRFISAASGSSLTPDIATADIYDYTALAAGLTINAPIGTPVDGNKLVFRFLDDGTARALTWNAAYVAVGVTLPTTTLVNKTTYVGCVYSAALTRWDVIAVATQA